MFLLVVFLGLNCFWSFLSVPMRSSLFVCGCFDFFLGGGGKTTLARTFAGLRYLVSWWFRSCPAVSKWETE